MSNYLSYGQCLSQHYCLHLDLFPPHQAQGLVTRMASSFVAFRVLSADLDTVLNNHAQGRRYGGDVWPSASMAYSSFCPFTCASSLCTRHSFLLPVQLLISLSNHLDQQQAHATHFLTWSSETFPTFPCSCSCIVLMCKFLITACFEWRKARENVCCFS